MNKVSYITSSNFENGEEIMRNICGPPVSGKDFLSRDYEKRFCINLLKEGNSLSILGIRRTGKSSLLKEVARLLKEEKYYPIEVDCQSYTKPSELFLGILKRLPNDTLAKFTEYLKSLKKIPKILLDVLNVESISSYGVDVKFDKKVRDYWNPISRAIEKIILDSDKKIILFLDELPYHFENIVDNPDKENYSEKEVKQILATLKSWRNEGIQMAICGSLNINNFLEINSISTKLLAGLASVDITPFSDSEAKSLLSKLAESKGIKWMSDDIQNKMLELLQDNIPFFIQHFFSFIAIEEDCDIGKLNEIYDLKVYPALIKEFLYQFEERLSKYNEEKEKQAEVILDFLAINKTSTFAEIRANSKIEIESKTYLKLISDELLKPVKGNYYSFSLKILETWWKEKRNL